jgi:CheY-like chemotaxis protein
MRDIAPNVPVILCSGFPEQEATNRFHGPKFAAFLGKPYTPEALLGAVQQVLGRSGESATA